MAEEKSFKDVRDDELNEYRVIRDNEENPVEEQKSSKFRQGCKIAGRIFAGILIVLLLVFLFRDFLIENSVRGIGTLVTGTSVEIESFKTTLDGKIRLKNIKVANPAGYRNPSAFVIESIYVKLDTATLLSQEPVVEIVDVKGVKVDVEPKGSGSNLLEIQENIERFAGKKSGKDSGKKKADSGSGEVSPLIKKISLSSMSVDLSNSDLDTSLTLPLPPVMLFNIGGKGTTLGETFVKIFGTVMNSVGKVGGTIAGGVNAIGRGGKALEKTFSQGTKKLNDGIKTIFNK